ncbi:MAG: UDP-2,3-diacylglucosamine diphosphatase [Xenophilus sp.]
MDGAAFAELQAPAGWRALDLVSDLHLQAAEGATLTLWEHYLASTPADAIFILGDLFEVWVGDDAADVAGGFESRCAGVLARATRRRPIFFLHGNRDFLLGQDFAGRTGLTLLAEPTVLVFAGQRWLLSHGDLLCLEDTDYLAFRAQVRSPAWQAACLARPLAERRALAQGIRTQSESHKADPRAVWADVDAAAARGWLRRADAPVLIHGHTHRPAAHDLGDGLTRWVLSDWDAAAQPPRAEVLRLTADGPKRIPLGA